MTIAKDIIEANDGEIPLSHDDFYRVVKKMGDPTAQAPDLKAVDFKESLCPIEPNHEDIYGVPTLAELGFEETNRLSPWLGIEYLLNSTHLSGKKVLNSSGKFCSYFCCTF